MHNKFFFNSFEIAKIFPFSLTIDRNLNIGFIGDSMKKIIGDIEGKDFNTAFKFVRPRLSIEMNFESFLEHQNMVVILESCDYPIKTRFRGQFVFIESRGEILYVNSPWFTDIIDLNLHNLLITDFAIHDPITDHLQLLKSQQMVNDDLNRLLEQTLNQRDELIEKNETIFGLAQFPDESPNPIVRINFDGEIIYGNPPAQNLISDKTNLFWMEFMSDIIESEGKAYTKIKEILGDTYEISIVPFPDNKYINFYLKDVSNILKYENELINLNSRLSAILENMQVGVLSESHDRKVIMANQLFCDIFGIPVGPDQLEGADCKEAAKNTAHLFKNNVDFISNIEKIIKSEKPVYGEKLELKDGRILERDFIPVIENGKMNGFIWRYEDVTEIVNHKESLRKVEDKYSRIIENLDFGLIEVDQNETIIKAYPAFCKLVGYTEDELLGRNAREILAFEEDLEVIEEQLSQRSKGDSGVYEVRIKCKSGDVKWMIISGAPIFNDSGDVIGSLGIHIDITDRINLQKELIQAKDQALQSVSLKEAFMANMSHEIRTPLHAMNGMLELIMETELDEEQSLYIQAIRASSINLLSLINDILDFSKIESGKMEISLSEVDLRHLVTNVYNSFKPQAAEKNLDFKFLFDDKIKRFVKADQLKITQVLFNLTHNAIKFTSKGSIGINVEMNEENERSYKVCLKVFDSGKGISPENQKMIFETFVQEDASISRNFGGSGLGLSISQSLVDLMGGELKLESELGKGTVFYFELELQKLDDKLLNGESELIEEQIDLKNVRVLVAEDNDMNQLLIHTLLTKMNADFEIVQNGQEVLDILEKERFNIILMDIQMPVMDGVTAFKIIRDEMKLSIPVIALSANTSQKDLEHHKKIGMTGSLGKPFTARQLREILNNVINNNTFNQGQTPSFSRLIEMSDGDEEFVQTIKDTFYSSTSRIVEEIEESLKNHDSHKINKLSHQLKPSLDLFDLEMLYKTALELEKSELNPELTSKFCGDLKEILKNWDIN